MDVKKNRYDGLLGRIMLQYTAVNQTLTQASDIISFETRNNKLSNSLGVKVTVPAKNLWEQAVKRREEAKIANQVAASSLNDETGSYSSSDHIKASPQTSSHYISNEQRNNSSSTTPVAQNSTASNTTSSTGSDEETKKKIVRKKKSPFTQLV